MIRPNILGLSTYYDLKQAKALFIAIILLYISFGAFSLYLDNSFLTSISLLLPIIALAAYFLMFRQTIFAMAILFVLPFSINLRDSPLGFGISLPAEPMMAALGVVFVLSLLYNSQFPTVITRHSFTLLIVFHIAWNIFTAITSTMPLVSFKFVAIRILYILVFYFYFGLLFNKENNRYKFLYLYASSLIVIIIYSIFRLLHTANFGEYYFACEPFFADHTIYAACICLLLPLNLIALLYPKDFNLRIPQITLLFISFVILICGLIFSYSRASWLSVGITMVFYIFLRFKLRFYSFLLIIALSGAGYYFLKDNVVQKLSTNQEVSQQSLLKHATSMTNIKTDVSNTERINRWKCAIRMFEAKPVLGFGPGTYQFQYNPFQQVSEMTYISTHHGDKGESHSEYLKPLSESGLLGFLSQLSLVLGAIFFGMRVIYYSKDKKIRLFATGVLLGLMTFFVHGFMNFFLDTDKFSGLYWGMLAMLIQMDIQRRVSPIHDTQ